MTGDGAECAPRAMPHGNYYIELEGGVELERDQQALQRQLYPVVSVIGTLEQSDERFFEHASSPTTGSHLAEFRDAVRARDGSSADSILTLTIAYGWDSMPLTRFLTRTRTI